MKLNTESPVFEFIGTLADYVMLNFLFLITCIPIVTIGAAASALYTITLREARQEHGAMTLPYLQAFRENLRKGTILFLLYFTAAAILLFNYVFWLQLGGGLSNVVLIVLTLGTALLIFSLFYAFALTARFENTVRQTIKNGLLLALANLKYTLAQFALFAGVFTLCYTSPVFRAVMVLFGFAFTAYCQSFLLNKVFKGYETVNGETQ